MLEAAGGSHSFGLDNGNELKGHMFLPRRIPGLMATQRVGSDSGVQGLGRSELSTSIHSGCWLWRPECEDSFHLSLPSSSGLTITERQAEAP